MNCALAEKVDSNFNFAGTEFKPLPLTDNFSYLNYFDIRILNVVNPKATCIRFTQWTSFLKRCEKVSSNPRH